jgi:transcription elongation factor Elf1
MEIEHFFTCPYCWRDISVVVDLSVDKQTYIEDCEVCCRPVQIRYEADGRELVEFTAATVDEKA